MTRRSPQTPPAPPPYPPRRKDGGQARHAPGGQAPSRGRGVEAAHFEAAAIIGVGLIGGSLGMALRAKGLAGRVTGAARRQETLDAAVRRGAIDAGTRDPAEAVAGADLVVLAAPVGAIIEHLGQLGGRVREGALVTDVGSTKVEIMRAAAGLPAGVAFVGGHPVAGSHESGPRAARADLFEGATWALTPRAGDPDSALERMRQLVAALGARPLVVEAEEHDALVALTSHLPHVAAWALVNAVTAMGGGREALPSLTAPSLRDTTRIAQSEPTMWRDILLSNQGHVLAAIAALRGELDRLERALAEGDADALASILDQAARARRELREG